MSSKNPTKGPYKQDPPKKDPQGPEIPEKDEPDSTPKRDDEPDSPPTPNEPEHDVERPESRPGRDQDIERGYRSKNTKITL